MPVRRELDVLRLAPSREGEAAHIGLSGYVDLDQLGAELARGDEVGAVGGEIHVVDAETRNVERVDECHRVRIAEVEALESFCDDDGELAIRA